MVGINSISEYSAQPNIQSSGLSHVVEDFRLGPMARSGPYKNTRKVPVLKAPNFIKEWRIYRDMTVAELAEAAGMSTGNVSALENRRQGYSPEGLAKLAAALRTTATALLEVNPLKDDIGSFWPLWQRASQNDREMLKSMAERLVGPGKKP